MPTSRSSSCLRTRETREQGSLETWVTRASPAHEGKLLDSSEPGLLPPSSVVKVQVHLTPEMPGMPAPFPQGTDPSGVAGARIPPPPPVPRRPVQGRHRRRPRPVVFRLGGLGHRRPYRRSRPPRLAHACQFRSAPAPDERQPVPHARQPPAYVELEPTRYHSISL